MCSVVHRAPYREHDKTMFVIRSRSKLERLKDKFKIRIYPIRAGLFLCIVCVLVPAECVRARPRVVYPLKASLCIIHTKTPATPVLFVIDRRQLRPHTHTRTHNLLL